MLVLPAVTVALAVAVVVVAGRYLADAARSLGSEIDRCETLAGEVHGLARELTALKRRRARQTIDPR